MILGQLASLAFSLRKTVGKVSPILVTLTSCNDSDFESSNVSLKENKPDGVNPNFNDIGCCVRKNEGKILWFSADCIVICKVSCWHKKITIKLLAGSARMAYKISLKWLRSLFKLQLHDAIYRLRFYSNSLIHILSLSNSHNNVASYKRIGAINCAV